MHIVISEEIEPLLYEQTLKIALPEGGAIKLEGVSEQVLSTKRVRFSIESTDQLP